MVNQVTLVGNLGADPESKTLPSGKAVTEIRIATTSGKDHTEWHNVIMFDKLADIAAQYLKKGKQVFLQGRIQTRSWDDKKSGEKKYRTEIIANEMKFLGAKDKGADEASDLPF